MDERQPFHRYFGLSWVDLFEGTSVKVELEYDLSKKQQSLDLVIIRKDRGPIPRPLPDGFEELAAHNLITFKSHQESLNDWAIWELVGHYVNYRKQSSPSMQKLLGKNQYRLFAVCARFPRIIDREFGLIPVQPAVYRLALPTLPITVIVASQLPLTANNAMIQLFSAREELVRYANAN